MWHQNGDIDSCSSNKTNGIAGGHPNFAESAISLQLLLVARKSTHLEGAYAGSVDS